MSSRNHWLQLVVAVLLLKDNPAINTLITGPKLVKFSITKEEKGITVRINPTAYCFQLGSGA